MSDNRNGQLAKLYRSLHPEGDRKDRESNIKKTAQQSEEEALHISSQTDGDIEIPSLTEESEDTLDHDYVSSGTSAAPLHRETEALLQEMISEEDLIQIAKSWAGSDISPMLAARKAISLTEKVIPNLPEGARKFVISVMIPLTKGFKVAAELDTGIGGSAIGLGKIDELASLSGQDNQASQAGVILFGAAVQQSSNLKTVFDIASGAGAVPIAAAGVIAPAATVGLAVGAWGLVGLSSYSTIKSGIHLSDKARFKHNTKHFLKLEKKLAKARVTILKRKAKGKNTKKSEAKIRSYEAQQDQLKELNVLIARIKKDRNKELSPTLVEQFANEAAKSEVGRRIRKGEVIPDVDAERERKKHFLIERIETPPSEAEKKIFKHLRKNRRDAFINHSVNTVGASIMAVGLTLLSASMFAAHGAPALMAAGLALTVLGISTLLVKNMALYINNKIAKAIKSSEVRKELKKDYEEKLNTQDFKDVWSKSLASLDSLNLTPKQRAEFYNNQLKYRLAFEHSYKGLLSVTKGAFENADQAQKAELEKKLEVEFYQRLFAMHPKERKQILGAAEKKAVNDKILEHAVGVKADDEALRYISKEDKQKIIARESRHTYRQKLTNPVVHFFKAVGRKASSLGSSKEAENEMELKDMSKKDEKEIFRSGMSPNQGRS